MVSFKSFVLAALATVATAGSSSAVIDLKPDNFDDIVIKSGKPTIVEFFAPWCGHCKTLAPVYEELAFAFEHAKDKVQIAKVDADAERSLGKRFGIQGFPTLKFFDGKSDKPADYSSGRDLESLSNFITEKTGVRPRKKQDMPSDVVMLTDKSFKETIGGDKNVLVAFTAPWCGHCKSLAPTWETVATDYALDDNVVIAKVDAEALNSKAVTQEQGVKSYPTIKFFPAGSKEPVDYNLGRTEQNILDFINEKAGTHRVPGGGLDAVAGTIEALNAVVAELTENADVKKVTAKLSGEVKKLKDATETKYAEYYVRVFDKLSKTEGYAAKELARLEGILAKSGLAPTKRDEIRKKTNVLKKFVDAVTGAADGKDEL